MNTQTLKVPGATLYYETRGSGPVLLMIAGGSTDAGIFDGVADKLADTYTVVTYDPRGNSRSHLDGEPVDVSIEDLSDDARLLLEAVADGPAYVFGSSSGGAVGLDLISRNPALVTRLVAHEPVVFSLLPDAAHWRAFLEDLYQTYQSQGVWAAGGKFGAGMGLNNEATESDSDMSPAAAKAAAMMQRMAGNFEFFFAHEVRPFAAYGAELAALDAQKDRIVLAGGADSRQHPPYRPAAWLAERWGRPMTDFPGDHSGYALYADTFAAKLRDVLK